MFNSMIWLLVLFEHRAFSSIAHFGADLFGKIQTQSYKSRIQLAFIENT